MSEFSFFKAQIVFVGDIIRGKINKGKITICMYRMPNIPKSIGMMEMIAKPTRYFDHGNTDMEINLEIIFPTFHDAIIVSETAIKEKK
ncbi:MAG: hypothetical protein COS94_00450 [Candidatus Hydrogenedentes bacterium CG07_land_8_20_14_0_80_42_17]|nr:MAG: hypothetical protein COS94_00450 [Candidatus Hydrogenedentes bacterium CG07_land_8_20_14_0_80_42_17]